MKKMYKSRNEENLLPFHIIKAASEGDVSAINAVLKHYEGYIAKPSNEERRIRRKALPTVIPKPGSKGRL